MSKTNRKYGYDTPKELNNDLRRCKGGVHSPKSSKRQKNQFFREVNQFMVD